MTKNLDEKIIYWNEKETINQVVEVLNKNKTCITSTDTILGFLAVTNEQGFQCLQKLKEQRKNKPFLVLIENSSKLKHFIACDSLSENIKKMLDRCWPGPVTVIFQAHDDCPSFLTSEHGTIALRCPDHQGLQTLLQSFDGLFSSSANKTGQPQAIHPENLDRDIISNVAYIVLDKYEPKTLKPSTILDCSKQKVTVVREGAYPIHLLEDYYGAPFNS